VRRGRPTCHRQFGEALAILAGDALLTLAFEVIAGRMQPAALAARCCAELARAAGPCALVGGQADDLDAETAGGDIARLEWIHRRKTGAMFVASLRLGGLSALGSRDGVWQESDSFSEPIAEPMAEQLTALDAYGKSIGLAFQIVDDLLDESGNEAMMGKRLNKDAGRNKLTFPALLGVEESRRRAARLVDESIAALAPFGSAAEGLEALARFVLERNR